MAKYLPVNELKNLERLIFGHDKSRYRVTGQTVNWGTSAMLLRMANLLQNRPLLLFTEAAPRFPRRGYGGGILAFPSSPL